MQSVLIIGIVASIFTGVSLLPQLVKLVKEHKPQDISMWMLAILFIGLVFWIVYGLLKNDWIIIASNGFSLIVNAAITFLNFYYKSVSFKRGVLPE